MLVADIKNISPSDLGYAYSNCRRCYWEKLHGLSSVPDKPASIVTTISKAQEKSVTEDVLKALGLPVVDILDFKKVESAPYKGLRISGYLDFCALLEDGTVAIGDAKASCKDDGYLANYKLQLGAYQYALQNPLKGEPLTVSKTGLIVWSPVEGPMHVSKSDPKCAAIKGTVRWVDMPVADYAIQLALDDLEALIAGPMPEPGPRCKVCKAVQQIIERRTSSTKPIGPESGPLDLS